MPAPKRILLTGATGFVGVALGTALARRGDTVIAVSRGGAVPFAKETVSWDELPRAGAFDAIMHLAGESVAQRWSLAAKERILSSRVDAFARLEKAGLRAPVLVSVSAIGYYGDRGEELLGEDASQGIDFLAETCRAWEKAALELGAGRTVVLRLGVVLGKGGGALAKMLPAFRLGLGGRLGGGRQWMSWIQLDDLVSLFLRAIDQPQMKGIYNAVSPEPLRNAEFARALAGVLGTTARVPVPALALRLALGEAAGMLLGSQRVEPRRLNGERFPFRYPRIIEALRASL